VPLPLTLANLLTRPAFGSRRDPDRAFDRILARAGQEEVDEWFVDDFRLLLREWAADEEGCRRSAGSRRGRTSADI
jgi:hypothetical protein